MNVHGECHKLFAYGNLAKQRDRTIQLAVGGTVQFDFAFLNQSVRADDLHAGIEQIISS